MRPAVTLEAEWRQGLRGSVSTGAKEHESSTESVWAAGFHHVTALSRLAGVLKLTNRLFLLVFQLPVGTDHCNSEDYRCTHVDACVERT
jgi:hypothetical protein